MAEKKGAPARDALWASGADMDYEFDIFAMGKGDFTRVKIAEAMRRLAQQSNFDGITVSDICASAGISRPTFYHYFEDKNAVLQWWWERLMSYAQTMRPFGDDWEADLIDQNCIFMQMTLENERFSRECAKSKNFARGYDSIYEYARRTRMAELTSLAEKRTGRPIDDSLEFAIRFYVLAESSIIARWMREGARPEAREVAESIVRCMPPELRAALEGKDAQAGGARAADAQAADARAAGD